MRTPKKIFFSHPISHYNTDFERGCVKFIQRELGVLKNDIINPNLPIHQKAYTLFGMTYLIDVVSKCDTLIAVPFHDGEFATGVFFEVCEAHRLGLTILTLNGTQIKSLTLDKQTDYLNVRPVSIKEARRRIRLKIL